MAIDWWNARETATWNGAVGAYNDDIETLRRKVSNAAKNYDWSKLLSLLRDDPGSYCEYAINHADECGMAPLHRAAQGNAPGEVVKELVLLGAWKSLRTTTNDESLVLRTASHEEKASSSSETGENRTSLLSIPFGGELTPSTEIPNESESMGEVPPPTRWAHKGEMAVDIARRMGHTDLVPLLQPIVLHVASDEILKAIELNFHQKLKESLFSLRRDYEFRMPQLSVMLEFPRPLLCIPIPGMYGGWKVQLEGTGENLKLSTFSWCRVAEGSERLGEVTASVGWREDGGRLYSEE